MVVNGSNIKIEILFYHREELENNLPALPHERFIITDQMAINIGRGMDFLNRHTRRNRDILIKSANNDEVINLIKGYRHLMLEPVII